jgi:ribosomal protein S10
MTLLLFPYLSDTEPTWTLLTYPFTRRAPCGNGTETYDHFELRVHKRLIDFSGSAASVKSVTRITLEPDVHIEVSVISKVA